MSKKTELMKKESRELSKTANSLWQEAENIEQAEMLPKFQYLVGKCMKIKDEYIDEKWFVYYLIKEVKSVYKTGRKMSAMLKCVSFDDRVDGIVYQLDGTEFHDTLKAIGAKEISRAEFDEALEKNYAKIQLATE